MMIDRNVIFSFFNLLNDNEIEYVLLRNIDNELPDKLERDKKDIDILVKLSSRDKFRDLLKRNGWKETRHPWDFGNNFIFLYSMNKLEFFKKDGMILDICYQLCCRSVNEGEWMPVDQMIQDSVWENRFMPNDFPWYQMCEEDELVHLLTRCILDKKEFKTGYIDRIRILMSVVSLPQLVERLQLIFFKFSDKLVSMILEGEYDEIISAYLTFSEY